MEFFKKIGRLFNKKSKFDLSLLANRFPDKQFEHVYTDIYGYKYYSLVDASQMSYSRSLQAEAALTQAEYNITRESLIRIVGEMKELANKGDIVSLFSLLEELDFRCAVSGEEETLLTLSSIYVFREDENADGYYPNFQADKISMWKKSDESRSFFLSLGFNITRNFSGISETDIVKSLKILTENESRISSILGRPSSLLLMI